MLWRSVGNPNTLKPSHTANLRPLLGFDLHHQFWLLPQRVHSGLLLPVKFRVKQLHIVREVELCKSRSQFHPSQAVDIF